VTTSNAGSRELHAVTKARYQKQMREELLSKGVLVAHDSVTGWCDCMYQIMLQYSMCKCICLCFDALGVGFGEHATAGQWCYVPLGRHHV